MTYSIFMKYKYKDSLNVWNESSINVLENSNLTKKIEATLLQPDENQHLPQNCVP